MLCTTLVLSGCAGIKIPTHSKDYDVPRMTDQSPIQELKAEIATVLDAEKNAKVNPTDIDTYIDVSITASDYLCSVWFDSMNKNGDDLDFKQRTVNIAGDGLIGFLGLSSGASTDLLAGLGMALGIANSGFDNYNGFRLSSAFGAVYDKLVVMRGAYAKELLALDNVSYSTAKRELRKYHKSCTRIAVENFIEKSVQSAKFTLQDFTSTGIRELATVNGDTAAVENDISEGGDDNTNEGDQPIPGPSSSSVEALKSYKDLNWSQRIFPDAATMLKFQQDQPETWQKMIDNFEVLPTSDAQQTVEDDEIPNLSIGVK